ncbi:LytR/AlgR family response regulator transcription factor [Alteromonas facilis]|uniref:LytR/AlgR family response regulator transcription factor n=1 Tax=Alteromonas facilis TaxID=2048004 RepID=UPI000C2844DF|nr:LytTR family DNA-binding domain-containing protein [Alteromonas facilis]
MYSFLILDDEPLARQGLSLHLNSCTDAVKTVCCEDAEEALVLAEQNHFHAIFLDIDLPGISGFGFLDELQQRLENIPPVVFTTGHAQFALKAFEYPVLDYLVKPICQSQIQRALAKLNTLHGTHLTEQPARFTASMTQPAPSKVSFRNGASWLHLLVNDIFWIEAAGDYMCIHAKEQDHIIRSTLRSLEQQLGQWQFVRINRSSLVNMQHVESCRPCNNGCYQIFLSDKRTLRVSRKYKMLMDEASHEFLMVN